MHHFLILGGDPRQLYLGRILKQAGQNVLHHYDDSPSSFSLKRAMERSDVILCPIPFTRDGKTIYSVNHLTDPSIPSFLEELHEGHTLFGGNLPDSVRERCRTLKIPSFDFMEMEDVACKNTVATAEGALAEAISLSRINLHKSSCLVLGWGRCARTLADRLKGFYPNVTVCARDGEKLAQAACLGFDTLALADLKPALGRYDFIFNTIPSAVLNASAIVSLKPEAVIIDIASNPGGVDFNACRQLGIRAKLCPGLPGVYAPMASAQILYEAVTERLS